jgi:uncharacterized protein (TIGR02757 family)
MEESFPKFNGLTFLELKEFLDEKVDAFNSPSFIEKDPISIPHRFSLKEDIESSALLISTIAWGNRTMIINNAEKMMKLMGNSPYDFIVNFNENRDLRFVHRTFQTADFIFFLKGLQRIYQHSSLEEAFHTTEGGVKNGIMQFRKKMFQIAHEERSEKHIANPEKGSSAKRLNMFLRWMCRKDKRGVDFGIWNVFNPCELFLPLDVHTGNISRKLGILHRAQDDWKAVEEIQQTLVMLDPKDPIKYDFALFGLGAIEKW